MTPKKSLMLMLTCALALSACSKKSTTGGAQPRENFTPQNKELTVTDRTATKLEGTWVTNCRDGILRQATFEGNLISYTKITFNAADCSGSLEIELTGKSHFKVSDAPSTSDKNTVIEYTDGDFGPAKEEIEFFPNAFSFSDPAGIAFLKQ